MKRLRTLQAKIPNNTAFLFSNTGDIRYLSQFEYLVPTEREALLLVTKQTATLLHASFSPVNSPAEINRVTGCNPEKLKEQLLQTIKNESISTLIIDKSTLFVTEYEVLRNIADLTIEDLDRSLIWQQRSIKSASEIFHMRQAAKITNQALTQTLKHLVPGISELEVENLLEDFLKKLGSGPPAFPTIVAFGKHTALPHHQPTELTLKENMPVLIDVGATYQGYCSDMTRTFWFGEKPDKKFVAIEKIISAAYEATIKKLCTLSNNSSTTLTAKEIDTTARTLIANKGYGQQFIHTTGHGLGLDIHEQPSLSCINETELQKNMIITIEPGIYIPGKFGYRYENTVLIGNDVEELTK